MNSKKADGYCLCGSIEYVVTGEPIWCGHCHCESCRRHTGGAVATFVAFTNESFELVQGALNTFESSPGVQRSFCGKCGSPISYQSKGIPDEIHLFLGSLANPESYKPVSHVFCREKLPWLEIADDGERYDTLPRDETT